MKSRKSKGKPRTRLFKHQTAPGAVPGTVTGRTGEAAPAVQIIAYSPDDLVERSTNSLDELDDFASRFPVTWINVEGLGDAKIIHELGERYGLHVLAMEDVVHVHQRAKVEDYDEHLFIVVRMPELVPHHAGTTGSELPGTETEQLALFLGKNFVLTFQDGRPGDCLDPLRERIRHSMGRIRRVNAGGLAYAILDTVIDHYFPVVEALASRLDAIDDELVSEGGDQSVATMHQIRARLLQLHRILRPHAEALHQLMRSDSELIADDSRLYLRDCHDHAVQLMDAIETCRETCADLRDAHFTALSTRQNEVMKTLTIIATLFMPMGFIAGLYGMNFDNMPELHWPYGYGFALTLMGLVAAGFLSWFRHRGWFRGGH